MLNTVIPKCLQHTCIMHPFVKQLILTMSIIIWTNEKNSYHSVFKKKSFAIFSYKLSIFPLQLKFNERIFKLKSLTIIEVSYNKQSDFSTNETNSYPVASNKATTLIQIHINGNIFPPYLKKIKINKKHRILTKTTVLKVNTYLLGPWPTPTSKQKDQSLKTRG